jgi:hypothetical protein
MEKIESEILEKAKKEIIEEKPILVLRGGSSYGSWREKKIYLSDLKNMSIGDTICIGDSIVRDSHQESLQVVYRDDKGVLLLLSIEEWDDVERGPYDSWDADHEEYKLIYIKFH